MTTNKTVLFGEQAAGVYLYTDIYIYDPANVISPEDSGKIVPAVGSLIVDNTKGLHNQQYTVTYVNPETYELTLVPSTFVLDTTAQIDRVLSYGNDIFMLYFSDATVTVRGNKIRLTRLIVDNKLSFFGNHAATYQLLRTKNNGNPETISRWYTPTGLQAGTAIPMLNTGVDGVRKCDGCYTEAELKEGETITCQVYSAAGMMLAAVELVAKKAHMLNEKASVSNPIVDMQIDANQIFADGTMYLYSGQDKEELTIFPTLIYSDGSTKQVAIDKIKGFIYGMEEISTAIPDMSYDILIKYYIGDDDVNIPDTFRKVYYVTTDTVFKEDKDYYTRTAGETGWVYTKATITSSMINNPIPTDRDYFNMSEVDITIDETSDEVKFIARHATVRIVESTNIHTSKISIVPVWNTDRWELKFLKYTSARDTSPEITDLPSSDNYVKLVSEFDGRLFNRPQQIQVEFINREEDYISKQSQINVVQVFNPASTQTTTNWLISDNIDSSRIYGDNTVPHIKPIIKYNTTNKYHIPADIFTANSTQSALEVFLDNFYWQSNPPKTNTEAVAPTPTHFIIKNDKGEAISDLIEVENFSSNLNLALDVTNSSNCYVGRTLVMEFIQQLTDEEGTILDTEIIYGVPVSVE